jgi:hypothetical protein
MYGKVACVPSISWQIDREMDISYKWMTNRGKYENKGFLARFVCYRLTFESVSLFIESSHKDKFLGGWRRGNSAHRFHRKMCTAI